MLYTLDGDSTSDNEWHIEVVNFDWHLNDLATCNYPKIAVKQSMFYDKCQLHIVNTCSIYIFYIMQVSKMTLIWQKKTSIVSVIHLWLSVKDLQVLLIHFVLDGPASYTCIHHLQIPLSWISWRPREETRFHDSYWNIKVEILCCHSMHITFIVFLYNSNINREVCNAL